MPQNHRRMRRKMAGYHTSKRGRKAWKNSENIYAVKRLNSRKIVLKLTSSPEKNGSKTCARRNESTQSNYMNYPKVDRRNLHRGCKRVFTWNYQCDSKIFRESKVVLVDICKQGRINTESRTNGSFQSICNFAK